MLKCRAKITVMAFKPSGKFYTSEDMHLRDDHTAMHGFELMELFKKNCPSTWIYSGLSQGFSSEFYYAIHVEYPDCTEGFCTFLLDRTKPRGLTGG